MTRLFNGFVALEMAVLWLLELCLCFLVFYILLLPGDLAVGPGRVVLGLHQGAAMHAGILAATIAAISTAIGMYRPEICLQTRRLLVNSVIAGLLAFPAVLLLSAVTGLDPSFILGEDALWPMKILLSWILLLFITRLCFRVVLRSGLLTRPIVIVGDGGAPQRTAQALRSLRRGFFSVVETIGVQDAGRLSRDGLAQRGVWGVVVTAEARRAAPVQALLAQPGVRVFDDVAFREQHLRRIDLDTLAADWTASVPGLDGTGRAGGDRLRRVLDVAVSLAVLTLTLPVMALAALAVRLSSPGPVFYRQERVGLAGRPFVLFKFRSMVADAEKHGPAWAAKRDPRVTAVGRLMRRTRIDELPQLFNVLRGEMSLVGPRPERPHFVAQLAAQIAFYGDRALVKPGITGWAQINYPYGASVEDARHKLAYDLYYVKHRSVWLDLQIIVSTVRVILFQEGAR